MHAVPPQAGSPVSAPSEYLLSGTGGGGGVGGLPPTADVDSGLSCGFGSSIGGSSIGDTPHGGGDTSRRGRRCRPTPPPVGATSGSAPGMAPVARGGGGVPPERERVALWNKREKRRIAGNAAPLRMNVESYLAKHPDFEMYSGQDKMPVRHVPMTILPRMAVAIQGAGGSPQMTAGSSLTSVASHQSMGGGSPQLVPGGGMPAGNGMGATLAAAAPAGCRPLASGVRGSAPLASGPMPSMGMVPPLSDRAAQMAALAGRQPPMAVQPAWGMGAFVYPPPPEVTPPAGYGMSPYQPMLFGQPLPSMSTSLPPLPQQQPPQMQPQFAQQQQQEYVQQQRLQQQQQLQHQQQQQVDLIRQQERQRQQYERQLANQQQQQQLDQQQFSQQQQSQQQQQQPKPLPATPPPLTSPPPPPPTPMHSFDESPGDSFEPTSAAAADASPPANDGSAAAEPAAPSAFVPSPPSVPLPHPLAPSSLSAAAVEEALANMAKPPAGGDVDTWSGTSFDLVPPDRDAPAVDVVTAAVVATTVPDESRRWRDAVDGEGESDVDDDHVPLVVNRARTDAEAVLFADDPEEDAAVEAAATEAASRAAAQAAIEAAADLRLEPLEVLTREAEGYPYASASGPAPVRQSSYPRQRRPSLLYLGIGTDPATWASNLSGPMTPLAPTSARMSGMLTPLTTLAPAPSGIDSLVRIDSGPLLSRDPSREQLTMPPWLASGGPVIGLGRGPLAAGDREMSFDYFGQRGRLSNWGSTSSNLRMRDVSDDQGLTALMHGTSIDEGLSVRALPRGMSVEGDLLAAPTAPGHAGGFTNVHREMSMEWPATARGGCGFAAYGEAAEARLAGSDATGEVAHNP